MVAVVPHRDTSTLYNLVFEKVPILLWDKAEDVDRTLEWTDADTAGSELVRLRLYL